MNEPTTHPTGYRVDGSSQMWDLQPVLIPLYALLLSFVVGGVLIALIGVNPFEAYWALLRGMFGTPERIAGSIARSVPFIGSALALAFAFRAGLFNIGAEGQLLIGGSPPPGSARGRSCPTSPASSPFRSSFSPASSAARSGAGSPASCGHAPAPTR